MKSSADRQIRNTLTRWVKESLPKVVPNGFESEHVDDLFPQIYPNLPDVIDFSIQVFCTLIDLLDGLGMPVKTSANIPLSVMVAPAIPLKVPCDLEIVKIELSDEPPNLYLIGWEPPKIYDPYFLTEIFKSPLPFQLSKRLTDKVTVLYVEMNGEQDEEEGNFVYYRHIELEYYPQGRLGS